MPPRKKKPTAASGGGGALSSLGGAFRSRGKKSRTKEVVKPVGGIVNTLNWLWKDRKPVPKFPPKGDDDDDDDQEDQVVRSLPSFIKLDLIPPGTGSDFKKTQEYRNYAEFEVSANLRILEFRNRLMEFFGEWQELKPSDDAPAATTKTAKAKKKEKTKKGKEPKVVKHKPPLPQKLMTGRQIWVDSTKLGDIVTFVGGGGGDGTGDCESMHSYLPWAGHGTELMRYGPVVIVLGNAELDVPPLEVSEIPLKSQNPSRSQLPSSRGIRTGSRPNTSNTMASSRPATSMSMKNNVKEDDELDEDGKKKKKSGAAPPVRTAQIWIGSNQDSHLVPQKSVHLIGYPISHDPTPNQFLKTNKFSLKTKKNISKGKVSPDYEELTTSLKPRPPLGIDDARVDLKGVNLYEVSLVKAQ